MITEATIDYLSMQVQAGAEVVKLFDSWAGRLKGQDFTDFAVKPTARIIAALKARHPGLPVIAFPREAGDGYIGFAKATGADCVAIDNSVTPGMGRRTCANHGCVQGNLAPASYGHGRPRPDRRHPPRGATPSRTARISSTLATASPPTPTPTMCS